MWGLGAQATRWEGQGATEGLNPNDKVGGGKNDWGPYNDVGVVVKATWSPNSIVGGGGGDLVPKRP